MLRSDWITLSTNRVHRRRRHFRVVLLHLERQNNAANDNLRISYRPTSPLSSSLLFLTLTMCPEFWRLFNLWSFSMFFESYYWQNLTRFPSNWGHSACYWLAERNCFSVPPSYSSLFCKHCQLPIWNTKSCVIYLYFFVLRVWPECSRSIFNGWSSRSPIHSFEFGWLLFLFLVALVASVSCVGQLQKLLPNLKFRFPYWNPLPLLLCFFGFIV